MEYHPISMDGFFTQFDQKRPRKVTGTDTPWIPHVINIPCYHITY